MLGLGIVYRRGADGYRGAPALEVDGMSKARQKVKDAMVVLIHGDADDPGALDTQLDAFLNALIEAVKVAAVEEMERRRKERLVDAEDWKHCEKHNNLYGPKDAECLRCVQAERDALLELTRHMDEHPENYDGPCHCKLCMSYGDTL